ncbi:DNA polymerase/3'-5' exonuclease PolX [Adhaeribacter pallidiroseus]|uniref:DNA polymerase/3'-5' exonuclease PolX n=1 Tax=Adhaeribacter pallidiroseus TaxID=2072847 RepID=A0A369QKX7_9BACT|nr:DNA polymerase/3'-5' exonuclease PolX [Adhaeribacter pallidiroseus]RDC64305.1 DNA polymerase/3'-5' exonuclease PolX [Adhaeribacter pallidiroseus]
MKNKDIIRSFRLVVSLLELHDENPFKIRTYSNAVANLERLEIPLAGLRVIDLEQLEGIGKSIASKIFELNQTGSFPELDALLTATPPGVVKMLQIKGIGPKKIRAIWKELGVETSEDLLQSCENNQIAALKGFGAKTQETIKNALLYSESSKGKAHYATVEKYTDELAIFLKNNLKTELVAIAGEVRRRLEIIETMLFVVGTDQPLQVPVVLQQRPELQPDPVKSGPFVWRGLESQTGVPVEVRIVAPQNFYNALFLHTGAPAHLNTSYNETASLLQLANQQTFTSEKEIYEKAGLAYIEPEMREGTQEIALARENRLPVLVTNDDLQGILHNHTTYSDGANTLATMATYCRDHGYQYLGICDHSKAAFYANGLVEHRVKEQHREIDSLNRELAPFKIFKGIEADILADGSLDYNNEVLSTFDFVVASIHSNLKMEEKKATERLLGAIQNPFTTILGHPTGRLLLQREGYPIDYKTIIDACAFYKVIIEINANPWRLDLDWRWVEYALSQGVLLSINPDAHSTAGYHDMHYGVQVARKGGLTKEMTFNAWPQEKVASYFEDRRIKALAEVK